jgi:hypothetical protein
MPESFFNLGVRFLAYREAKGTKCHNKKVVKHNMDLRFCVSYIFMIKVSLTHTYCLFVCILIKLILRYCTSANVGSTAWRKVP